MRLATRLSLSHLLVLALLVLSVPVLAFFQLRALALRLRTLPQPASPYEARLIAEHLAQAGLGARIPPEWLEPTLAAGGWAQVVDAAGQEVQAVGAPPDRPRRYSPPQLAVLAAGPAGDPPQTYMVAAIPGPAGPQGAVILAAPVQQSYRLVAYLTPAVTQLMLGHFLRGIGLAALAGLFISVATGLFLAWRLSRPLTRLAAELQAAARGDFTRRIPVRGRDELALLAGAFNHLMDRLAAAEAERNRLEAARRDLIANLSHDLRTPLTSLQGFAERLAEADLPPEVRQRYGAILARRVQELDALIGDLLELSRLQSAPALHPEPFDLAELIREQVIALLPEAEAAGVQVEVDLPEEGTVPVRADRRLVSRAVQNLLVNALRHGRGAGPAAAGEAPGNTGEPAPDGTGVDPGALPDTRAAGKARVSRVAVRLLRTSGGVGVAVADDGPGIPPEELPFVFDRYYRGTSATARGPGSGLGLAIVRQVAEVHRGRVTVESAPGAGATFTLWLPAETLPAETLPAETGAGAAAPGGR